MMVMMMKLSKIIMKTLPNSYFNFICMFGIFSRWSYIVVVFQGVLTFGQIGAVILHVVLEIVQFLHQVLQTPHPVCHPLVQALPFF